MGTAQDYAQWIVENQDKQGTPEFETVAKAYEVARSGASASKVGPLGALSQGINYGLTAGLPIAAGAYAGGALGATLGPFGMVGGAVLGGLAASPAAEPTRNLLNRILPGAAYSDVSELPQEMRPIGKAGEVIGGAATFAGAPYATAKPLAEVPGVVRPIVAAAREAPKTFAATEAGTTLGAAQGAAIAELVAPGNKPAAFGAEVAGGFGNPAGLLARGIGAASRGTGTLYRSFTPAGREEKAATALREALEAFGEKPEDIARLLKEPGLEGVALTAGQKSGSPTLMALEATLASKNPNFDTLMRGRMRDNFAQMRSMIAALEQSGDPRLLTEAARLRSRYFDVLLNGRVQAAQAQAERAASGIRGDKASASERAVGFLEDALADARATEKTLWKKVPKDEALSPGNTVKAYQDIMEGSYRERPMPPEFVVDFVKRVSKSETVNSGELISFRSDMLARARQARSQKDWVNARIYENMADGALADLAGMEGTAANEARSFSKSLHDAFSRSFASDALAVKSTGAERIAPEAVLERAFGGGGTLSAKRFKELEAAAQFSGKSMIHEQEEFLRSAATQSVDPQTGKVNPRALENFLRSNEAMLNRFPSLRRDLEDASTAEQVFRNVQAASQKASKAIESRAIFSEVLKGENPASAIRAVITSRNPSTGYEQLVRLAQRGPQGAVDGLKASTLDYAAKASTSTTGDFSFARYTQLLTKPLSGSGPSLLETMRRSGVMNDHEAMRMQFILAHASKIEKSLGQHSKMSELVSQPDALFDLVVRAVGANIGGASSLGQATGAPLVLAGAGSKAARNLFEKVPRTRVISVMQEAAANPQFMAALLEKPKSQVRARELHRQINAFLLQAGFIGEAEQ